MYKTIYGSRENVQPPPVYADVRSDTYFVDFYM